MRTVKCKDCGKSYDFDKDDFCPKCGSFNPPANAAATFLERDLLSRFGTAQPAPERRESAPDRGGERPAYRYAPAGAPRQGAGEQQRPGRARQAQGRPLLKRHTGAAGLEGVEESRGRRALLVALGIGLALAAVLVLWASGQSGGAEVKVEDIPAEAVMAGEEISVGELQLSVDDVRWLYIGEDSRLYREGYDLLLVDVYITGGDDLSDRGRPGDTYLTLGDRTQVDAVTDALTANRLMERSVYTVELRDAAWEDPLMGSMAFYVPAGAEEATLVLEWLGESIFHDMEDIDVPVIEGVTMVELELPAHRR